MILGTSFPERRAPGESQNTHTPIYHKRKACTAKQMEIETPPNAQTEKHCQNFCSPLHHTPNHNFCLWEGTKNPKHRKGPLTQESSVCIPPLHEHTTPPPKTEHNEKKQYIRVKRRLRLLHMHVHSFQLFVWVHTNSSNIFTCVYTETYLEILSTPKGQRTKVILFPIKT